MTSDATGPGTTSRRALVVGDVMLDVFTEGEASRLSPEAPVPVVRRTRRRVTCGGAGNSAANIAAAGDRVALVGVVGADVEGDELIRELQAHGIDVDGVVTVATPTTSKHRVLANGQQLVRLDVESEPALPEDVEQACLDACRRVIDEVDVVLISDYAKGVCTPRLCGELIEMTQLRNLPVVVDPKGVDFARYRGATLITPNVQELRVSARRPGQLIEVMAEDLRQELAASVLLTRSADGMSLFQHGEPAVHLPTEARDVFDVTGAGDTVASMVAVLLARGWALEPACRLANRCAGIVVGRVGTSPITRDEFLGLLGELTGSGRHARDYLVQPA